MSRKNSLQNKKIRRLERALRRGRSTAYTDLVKWLLLHGHAATAGEALSLIGSGRVMSESHVVGVKDTPEGKELERWVPAEFRVNLRVLPPDV